MLYFSFENVPVHKIEQVEGKFMEVLKNISSGKEKIDMNRMSTILEKYILERLSSLENSPHDDIAFHLIGDILYGNTELDVRVITVIYQVNSSNFILV